MAAAINSLEGLDVFEDVMRNTGASDWYHRTKAAVGLSTGEYITPDEETPGTNA